MLYFYSCLRFPVFPKSFPRSAFAESQDQESKSNIERKEIFRRLPPSLRLFLQFFFFCSSIVRSSSLRHHSFHSLRFARSPPHPIDTHILPPIPSNKPPKRKPRLLLPFHESLHRDRIPRPRIPEPTDRIRQRSLRSPGPATCCRTERVGRSQKPRHELRLRLRIPERDVIQ